MKSQTLLLGLVLCLAASAQKQTTPQSANRVKQSGSNSAQVVGCVDQQQGQYVLRDARTGQLILLQPTNSDANDSFARFVGHEVQASGSESSGTLKVTQIGRIADMCSGR